MRFVTFLFVVAFLLLSSCSEEDEFTPDVGIGGEPSVDTETDPEEPADMTDFVVPTVIPTGNEKYLNMDSDYVFDQSTLNTYELLLPEDALAVINDDPAAEEFVEGTLIFQGDTISPVGIRYKGSIGAFVGCLSEDDPFNPSGYKTCTKLSMKVKINWEGRDEKFFKLKKLQFHSMNLDPSQLHERLGYWLFRQMGVPGPRSVHARLMINGEFAGLFALTEQIDNRLIKYNFDDDDGNLYKEIWPLSMDGMPYSEQAYIDALRTNEDDNPSVDIIRGFGQALADADPTEINSIVEQFMDIDEIISYSVVDRTIRHDDGPYHWYCGFDGCENHNYFWYEEPSVRELHLIPWDLDNAFENIISNSNPVTPIADDWGETRNNCRPFSFGAFGFPQWSAACDRLTLAWSNYENEYNQKKLDLINGPLSQASTNQMIDTWMNQISEATQEASNTHDDAISIALWEASVAQLKEQLEFARNN